MNRKALGMGLFGLALLSGPKVWSSDGERLPLQKILQQEAEGEAIDRAALMAGSANATDQERWLAGQVKRDGSWEDPVKIEKLHGRLANYRKERGSNELNLEGHLRMARWCAEHGLSEQEKSHWYGVLQFQPDHALAHQRLGDQQIRGRWFSKDEVDMATERSRRMVTELRKWLPKLQEVEKTLGNSKSSLAARKKALTDLNAIHEEEAIAALEWMAVQSEGSTALAFVTKIDQMFSHEACLALTRIALADPTSETGQKAIQGLKRYPLDLYVPELLSLLRTPIQTQTAYRYEPNGNLVSQVLLFQEAKDQKQIHEIVKTLATSRTERLPLIPVVAGNASRLDRRVYTMAHPAAIRSLSVQTEHDASRQNDQVKMANLNLEEEMIPVFHVLKSATGLDLPNESSPWWEWWNRDYAYVVEPEKKVYRTSERSYSQPVLVENRYEELQQTRPRHECLVAGSLIQTEEGMVPIEQVRVGDRVLSQDSETGEVAWQVVLQTTKRPPEATLAVKTQDGELEATAGHSWWVAGNGWLRTKQLRKGMTLHTLKGTTRIESVEEKPQPVATYNLIVDGFHTYFVGKERILSYDNTELKGTLRTVPGLEWKVLAKNP